MQTITARKIADALEQIAPLDSGVTGDQQGFIYGDAEKPVRGVACMWCAHSASLRRAMERGLDFVIVHEALFEQPQKSPWYDGPRSAEEITANRMRLEVLTRGQMVVYRIHSSWDALEVDGVPDCAARALKIPGLKEIARQKYFKVMRLPEPMTVAALAEHTKTQLCLPSVRTFGDPDKKISAFAFLVGGFGENQIHMPQAAAALGAEAILIGEMSEFVVMNALECQLPVIETLHSASEIPAIRRQAELLKARFPEIPVEYVPSGALNF